MKELIITSFFKQLVRGFEVGTPVLIAAAAVFIAGIVLYVYFTRTGKPMWVMPLSFLAGEICCEVFWQTTAESDAGLFLILGFVFVAGLLGTTVCELFYKIQRKLRRS